MFELTGVGPKGPKKMVRDNKSVIRCFSYRKLAIALNLIFVSSSTSRDIYHITYKITNRKTEQADSPEVAHPNY